LNMAASPRHHTAPAFPYAQAVMLIHSTEGVPIS
jgi:hypothetical protein